MLSMELAIRFFTTVLEASPLYRLPIAICSLTLSFDLDIQSSDDQVTYGRFWDLWKAAVPRMTLLRCLNLSYAYDENFNPLLQLTRLGGGSHILPPSLRKLHLRPVPDDFWMTVRITSLFSVHHSQSHRRTTLLAKIGNPGVLFGLSRWLSFPKSDI